MSEEQIPERNDAERVPFRPTQDQIFPNSSLIADELHRHIAALWKLRDDVRVSDGEVYELDLAQRRIGSAARKLTKAARELRRSQKPEAT